LAGHAQRRVKLLALESGSVEVESVLVLALLLVDEAQLDQDDGDFVVEVLLGEVLAGERLATEL
jgi:hypothetical protein